MPIKQKAELIYFARVDIMREKGFDFRQYNAFVLDNWEGWDGSGEPPRAAPWD